MTKRSKALFAFYDASGTGMVEYQDSKGRPVARGLVALDRWRKLGCPEIRSYDQVQRLGLV